MTITKKQLELFESLKAGVNANMTDANEALLAAFQMMMGESSSPAPVQAHVEKSIEVPVVVAKEEAKPVVIQPEMPTPQVPVAKVVPAPPLSVTEVEEKEFVPPGQMHTLVVLLKKPCHRCPLAADCLAANKGAILAECPSEVHSAKARTVQAGEMDIVIQEIKGKFHYTLCEVNGSDLGEIVDQKSTKDLIRELDLLWNPERDEVTVRVRTVLVPGLDKSSYTKMYCEILHVVEEEMDEFSFTEQYQL